MKTIVVALLLIASCIAAPLKFDHFTPAGLAKRDIAKRDTTVSCYPSACSDIGGPCTTSCDDCFNAFTTCQNGAFSNETALCECYSNYVDCAAAKKSAYPNCDSEAYHEQCLDAFSSFGGNCTCGTPYTGSLTNYECTTGYCSNTSVCTAYKSEGQSCTDDDQCGSNMDSVFSTAYVCNASNLCEKLNYFYPGDPCSQNSDCVFYGLYNLGCTSGVCSSQAVGKTCPILGLCGGGLYCDDDNKCQKMSTIGGSCNSTAINNACPDLSYCDNNVCVAALSRKVGESCVDDMECATPLYCSYTTKKCANPLSTPSCMSDSNCTNINQDYYGCVCTGTSATCQTTSDPDSEKVFDNCQSTVQDLQKCLSSNGCSFLPVAGGCAQTHCSSQYECYYACALQNVGTVCSNYKPTCGDSGVEKNAVAWVMVAIAVVAALMF